MRSLLVLGFVCVGLLAGCEPSVKSVNYEQAGETPQMCELDVYAEGLTVSETYKVVGQVEVSDTGFSINCGQDVVMTKIKTKACEANADAIQMLWVSHPSWYGSTCFQAGARFLKYD